MLEKLSCIPLDRQAYWTEAIAVGSTDWLKNSARQLNLKQYALKNEKLEDENSYIHYLTGKN